MVEKWKPIKGYEKLYEVSNLGNVKSLKTNKYNHKTKQNEVINRERILKPSYSKGYLKVTLLKDNVNKSCFVHRLVAQAFIPNPNNLPQVNHIKEFEKDNNCVDNLEWCDRKYNVNYGTGKNRSAKSREKPILQYDLENNLIKEWESIRQASKVLNFNETCLGNCCKKRCKTSYGSIWRYKYE